MYNVKGPSKIVAKTTRRGLPQNIDTFRDHPKSKLVTEHKEVIKGPKPVFQNIPKKCNNNNNNNCRPQEVITQQHEELIKYINDSWNSIYDEASSDSSTTTGKIMFYDDDPSPYLQNFKPFDLEGWWGKRLYNYITNSVNHNS